MIFEEKYFSRYIILIDQISLLLLKILGNICIVIICFPVDDVINFEINFSYKPFSCNSDQVKHEKSF